MAISISEFSVTSSNTNQWAQVKTSAVGGDTKYGICVTNKSNPRYVFIDSNFCPSSTSGSVSIVELYANSEGGSGSGDPNDGSAVYDGVALVNMGPPTGALSSNASVYGIYPSSKTANYVYDFTNKGSTSSSSTSVSVSGNGTKLYLETYTPSTIAVTNSSQTLSTAGKVCTGNITIPAVNYCYSSPDTPTPPEGNNGDIWLVVNP